MMTGLLNTAMLGRRSDSAGSPRGPPGGPPGAGEKTPIELTRSSRRISLVASRPPIIGMWISIRTRWKPPVRHRVTASRPFMAVCHRTLNRFMKASRSLRLIILSSTMSTLMGGTPADSGAEDSALRRLFLVRRFCGCGDDALGAPDARGAVGGGVATRWVTTVSTAGGVEGGAVAEATTGWLPADVSYVLHINI